MNQHRKTAKAHATISAPAGSWFARNKIVLRFGLIFGLVTAIYYVLALTPWVDGDLFPAYLRTNACVSNALLNWLGQSCQADGTTIRSPQFAITIKRGCDALEPSWLFCAAVLAFPAPWRRRLPGMAVGVTAILTLNLVRIVSLYFIGIHLPGFFETMHLEIWPVLFIIVALLLWIAWVSWSRRNVFNLPNAKA
jgi:exosortase H (IPTLxxWG-CTERM-specific)